MCYRALTPRGYIPPRASSFVSLSLQMDVCPAARAQTEFLRSAPSFPRPTPSSSIRKLNPVKIPLSLGWSSCIADTSPVPCMHRRSEQPHGLICTFPSYCVFPPPLNPLTLLRPKKDYNLFFYFDRCPLRSPETRLFPSLLPFSSLLASFAFPKNPFLARMPEILISLIKPLYSTVVCT